MSVSSALPITYTQPQGSQNGASVDTGAVPTGDFSALLFLILGNLQLPAKSMAGAVEANSIPVAIPMMDREPAHGGRATTEPQSQVTAPLPNDGGLLQFAPDLVASVTTQWGKDCENEDASPEPEMGESHDSYGETADPIEVHLFHAMTMIPDPSLEAGASLATVGGVENKSAGVEPQSSGLPGLDTLAPERTLEAGAIHQDLGVNVALHRSMGAEAEGTTVISPAKATSSVGTVTLETPAAIYNSELPDQNTGGSVKLSTDRTAKTTQRETTENVTELQMPSSEVASGEASARIQGLMAYARDGMAAAVSTPGRGHVVIEDNGLQLNGQLDAQSGSTAQDAVVTATPSTNGKETSNNAHQGEQDGLFQERFQNSNNQQAQAPLHITGHDRASPSSAHTIEVAQEAPTREHDWRPLVDHVAGEIKGHIRIGKSEAVIRLDPPELGNLKIDLRMEGDKVEARIYAENQESATLIEAHLPELRQALAESRVEHVEVRVDSANWNSARGDGQQGRHQEAHDGQAYAHDNVGTRRNDSKEREPARTQTVNREAGRVSMWA
jgi:flagellar hook-length control protein FliK